MDAKNRMSERSILKNPNKLWSGAWKWIHTIYIYFVTFIVTVLLIFIVDYFIQFFNLNAISNPNSARYLLSSLIQSQAAILAIVITITLIAVQLAAQSYSPRVLDIFQRNIDFKVLLIIYGISIFFMSGVLKIIPENLTCFQNQTTLHFKINIAIIVSFFTFTILFPYIRRTIDLLKPSNIIEELSKDVTYESLILTSIDNKNLDLENRDKPLIPIVDIIRGSCMRHDFETTRKGLNVIGIKGLDILNNGLSESEADRVTTLFVTELENFGKLAVNIDDDDSAKETVKTMHLLNKKLAENRFHKSIERLNGSLEIIGIAATKKKLLKTAQEAIDSVYDIGKISIENKLPMSSEQSVLILGALARSGIDNKLEQQASHPDAGRAGALARSGIDNKLEHSVFNAIRSLQVLGIKGVKGGFEKTARKALWSLELIGKTHDIHELKLRFEKWKEFNEAWEQEGDLVEETIDFGSVEEYSLFGEVLTTVYFIGETSIKEKQYQVSTEAMRTLQKIEKTSMEFGFDEGVISAYIGNLIILALEKENKEVVNFVLNALDALEDIGYTVYENLESVVYNTASAIIKVGTFSLEKRYNEMASKAAQALVYTALGIEKSKIVDKAFNESNQTCIQKFKNMYVVRRRQPIPRKLR